MRKLLLLGLVASLSGAVAGCQTSGGAIHAPPPGPPSTATESRGITQGGAQDIGRFRAIVNRGEVPSPETLDPVGFFAEHAVDLPPADCGDTICVHPFLGVMPTFNGGNWTIAYVGMNTSVDPTAIERQPLHVVVAVETTDVGRYWHVDFASTLSALAAELQPGDRISLLTFSDRLDILFEGVDPTDPVLADIELLSRGSRAALYDALATSAQILERSDHIGAGRIILVTTGRANAGLAGHDRILELGAALARSGTSLSVLGIGDSYLDELPAQLGSMGAGTYGYAENNADLLTMFAIEGRTSLAPIAIDFEMRIVAADGYDVGDIYGARSATAVASEAVLTSPVLMVGNRTGSSDIDEGRRGGGGGLFVRLYADARRGDEIGIGAAAFTVYTRWTDPVSGEVFERSQQVRNGLRAGQNPGGMWPHFSDPNFGKPFMMLNMYLALRGTVRLFHDGDCASSLGVEVMLEPSYAGWQDEYMDPDIDADWLLLGATTDNVLSACEAIHEVAPEPVPPTNVGVGCGFL